MGGINGFGSQIARIVKTEKFISPNYVYYAYLTQPIVAAVIGYLLLPEKCPLPDIYTFIGGIICTLGLYLLSRS
jgi:drug/metabolite transporter (DMT)-like permease